MMDKAKLAWILEKHAKWLRSEAGGERANLSGANLYGADLFRAKGCFVSLLDYLATLEKDDRGWIVYKRFGMHYPTPSDWTVCAGSIIEEPFDIDRTKDCSSGINFSTREWQDKQSMCADSDIWVCRIRFEWEKWVCVPYMSDGKARTGKIELIRKLKNDKERR